MDSVNLNLINEKSVIKNKEDKKILFKLFRKLILTKNKFIKFKVESKILKVIVKWVFDIFLYTFVNMLLFILRVIFWGIFGVYCIVDGLFIFIM